tara:strand:- start:28413 stop:28706 length:294 start_codon:yes stop_codon:yes gene_type:complete
MDKEVKKCLQEIRPIIFRIVLESLSKYKNLDTFILEEELYHHMVDNSEHLKEIFNEKGKQREINKIIDYLIDYYTNEEYYERCSIMQELKSDLNSTE